MKAWTVGVRALCEFTARSGDLDLRFTPATTAQEGILGHQQLKLRRPEHYEAEVPLSYEMEGLLVRGRADGFDPVSKCLEVFGQNGCCGAIVGPDIYKWRFRL